MSNQYEVEHNIPAAAARPDRDTRRVDMSSFLNFLSQITPDTTNTTSSSATTPRRPHEHIFTDPTPRDITALYGLVRDQFSVLASTAPTQDNRNLLEELVRDLIGSIDNPPERLAGVSAEFVDALDRVDKKRLRADDTCPICAECFLDDKYPLVVELPCHPTHRFDLECIQPWLRSKGNCPLCKKDFSPKPPKEVVKADDDDDEDDDEHGMYA
jgi:hypothetical protein